MTREIQLSKGKVALIDDDDYERISQYKWHFANGYASHTICFGSNSIPKKQIFMHRFIMNAPEGIEVDHINRKEKLDNRKSNLRIATASQNAMNKAVRRDSLTGLKGVFFDKKRKYFTARIKHHNKRISLGCFKSAEDAGRAYDQAAREFFQDFASLNFRGERETENR